MKPGTRRQHTRLAALPSADLADAVRAGLSLRPRRLPCRFFYDAEGSALFEQICSLPEYYLTRAEHEILVRYAREIVARLPPAARLVELGSGSARKTALLIEALIARAGHVHYAPIDISPSALEDCAARVAVFGPGVSLHTIEAEYTPGLEHLEATYSGPRLVAWLGSNVGNFERGEAARFLARATRGFGPDDRFLLGVDLRKSKSVLERAYDDAAGVTARFNLNLLSRVNAELGADFELDGFRHVALYDELAGRIEMHLESVRRQRVRLAGLDLTLEFEAGERIHTEDSYKYSPGEIESLAAQAGLKVEQQFLDPEARFALVLLKCDTPAA